MIKTIKVHLLIAADVEVEVNTAFVDGFKNEMAEKIAVSQLSLTFNHDNTSTEDAAFNEFIDMVSDIEGDIEEDKEEKISYNWDCAKVKNLHYEATGSVLNE